MKVSYLVVLFLDNKKTKIEKISTGIVLIKGLFGQLFFRLNILERLTILTRTGFQPPLGLKLIGIPHPDPNHLLLMPERAHRHYLLINKRQQLMLDIGLTIPYRHMLVPLIGLDPALNANDLVLEEEFHAQEVLYVDLGLLHLDGGLGFLGLLGRGLGWVLEVFLVLASEVLVYALEGQVLPALLVLGEEDYLGELILFVYLLDYFF